MNIRKPSHLTFLFSMCLFALGCTSKKSNEAVTTLAAETIHSSSTSMVDDTATTVLNTHVSVHEDSLNSDSKKVEMDTSISAKTIEKNTSTNNSKSYLKKPKIEFEEVVWDFGEIEEGDIIEKKFIFKNTGSAPLEILSTSATCGCTRPSFPLFDTSPGETGTIGVQYNSVGKEGKQSPEVRIESNTSPKTTILKLQGVVIPKNKTREEYKKTTSVQDSSTINN
ncbi:MAG: DUF1573 domain-containing protein [Saprospiraceae bacterium]|nr:DUF1573 domain-containing protein [Saprospiraceae bacterium]